jgi:large subunit ribosomal protein L30
MATRKKKGGAKSETIRIRQVRSYIGCRREHREVLRSLGLRRIRHEVERPDTPAIRGMVAKIPYLVEIVEDAS